MKVLSASRSMRPAPVFSIPNNTALCVINALTRRSTAAVPSATSKMERVFVLPSRNCIRPRIFDSVALAKVTTFELLPCENIDVAAAAFVPPFVCMMAPVRLKVVPKPKLPVV